MLHPLLYFLFYCIYSNGQLEVYKVTFAHMQTSLRTVSKRETSKAKLFS